MAMIGARSVVSDEVLQHQADRNIQLVERFHKQILGTVTQQIVVVAGYVLGTLACAFAAVTSLTLFFGTSVFIAAPVVSILVVVGSASFYVAQNYINLNDPEVVRRIRGEIEEEFKDFQLQHRQGTLQHLRGDASYFLESIANKYGWEAIFFYGLPEPELFKEIMCFQAELISIGEIISLYEKIMVHYHAAQQKYGGNIFEFEFPHPSEFRAKWKRETIREGQLCTHITEILKPGRVEKLAMYGIVERSERDFLVQARRTYLAAYSQFSREIRPEWDALKRSIGAEKKRYYVAVDHAREEYLTAPVHANLRVLRKRQLKKESDIASLSRHDSKLIKAEREFESLRKSLAHTLEGEESESKRAAARYLSLARQRLDKVRERILDKYKPLRDGIGHRFAREFAPLFRELEIAKHRRQGRLRIAANEYNKRTLRSRERYVTLIAGPKRRYFEILERIERAYLQRCA